MPEPKRLNVGCGRDYRDGWVNLDINPTGGLKVDVEHDMTKVPWPFAPDTFDHVLCSHVLEHVPHDIAGHGGKNGFVVVMEELHRILRPGGTLEVRVPHWRRGNDVWADPTHTRVVHEHAFTFFDRTQNSFYTAVDFRPVSVTSVRHFWLGRYMNESHWHRVFGGPAPRVLARALGRPHELVVVLRKA